MALSWEVYDPPRPTDQASKIVYMHTAKLYFFGLACRLIRAIHLGISLLEL